MKKYIIVILGCLLSLVPLEGFAQNIDVKGTVVDALGEGLPGANVAIKGANTGVITDLYGKFKISVPNAKTVLIFSFIGYQQQEVTIGSQRDLLIELKDDSKLIDEVVIVGYGSQKKINATGAVKTIDTKSLESRPIGNVVQGLQGAVAGLNITNDAGGALGQSMNINIRGVGSIGTGSNSSPLILIDGMEGDLTTLNPNDIENISVLKDASSAAIYGSRAPFGVILVTTKSGTQGKTTVNYTGNVRISQPSLLPDLVDSYTFALMANDSYTNVGDGAVFGQGQLDKILKFQRGELPYGIEAVAGKNEWAGGQRTFGNTNWYDVFLKKQTTSQEHNVTVSGGGEKISYYFSANYLSQTGLFNYADESLTRFGVNGKVNVKFNDKLKMLWSTRLINTNNEKPMAMNNLFFHNLGRISPLTPVSLPTGGYNPESLISAIQDGGRDIRKQQQLYNQLSLTYEPIKDWRIHLKVDSRLEDPRSSRQVKKIKTDLPNGDQTYTGVFSGVADKFLTNGDGSFVIQPSAGKNAYEVTNGHVNSFSFNGYTDYVKALGKHVLTGLLGMQTEYYSVETNRSATNDILIDDRPFLNPTATTRLTSSKIGEWSSMGFFGRLNYNYADRYMAEVNLRYDGASRFPSEQRWAMFPSFSLGWNVANESFWKPLANVGFEYFKLRGSYGTLGNQNTQSFYQFHQQMNSNTGALVIGGAAGNILDVYAPFSPSLTWERVENVGAGIEWGLFNNRLTGAFDWSQRTTKDMIADALKLASIYGGNAPKTNNAELRTRGWELELSWRDMVNKNFSYGISGTISDYKTVVTKFESADGNINGWYAGKKMGDMWGFEVVGIAKSDKEMNDYMGKHSQNTLGSKWGGGDLMYRDIDDDGSVDKGSSTLDNHGDLKVIGNSTPRYAYSFTLDAQYKFIDFRAFFQGIGKRDLNFGNSVTFFGIEGKYNRALFSDHLDYFRYAGAELGGNMDNPYYGRLRTDGNNTQVSDRFTQDGSYLRLKNLQIGFSLPQTAKLSRYIRKARLYVSGENLFTFTKLDIYDPEAVGSASDGYGPGKTYPMFKVYSVGLELTF